MHAIYQWNKYTYMHAEAHIHHTHGITIGQYKEQRYPLWCGCERYFSQLCSSGLQQLLGLVAGWTAIQSEDCDLTHD